MKYEGMHIKKPRPNPYTAPPGYWGAATRFPRTNSKCGCDGGSTSTQITQVATPSQNHTKKNLKMFHMRHLHFAGSGVYHNEHIRVWTSRHSTAD